MVCGSHFSTSQCLQGRIAQKLKKDAFPDQHLGDLQEKVEPPRVPDEFQQNLDDSVRVYNLEDKINLLQDRNAALKIKCTDLSKKNEELSQQLHSIRTRENASSALDNDTKVCT